MGNQSLVIATAKIRGRATKPQTQSLTPPFRFKITTRSRLLRAGHFQNTKELLSINTMRSLPSSQHSQLQPVQFPISLFHSYLLHRRSVPLLSSLHPLFTNPLYKPTFASSFPRHKHAFHTCSRHCCFPRCCPRPVCSRPLSAVIPNTDVSKPQFRTRRRRPGHNCRHRRQQRPSSDISRRLHRNSPRRRQCLCQGLFAVPTLRYVRWLTG